MTPSSSTAARGRFRLSDVDGGGSSRTAACASTVNPRNGDGRGRFPGCGGAFPTTTTTPRTLGRSAPDDASPPIHPVPTPPPSIRGRPPLRSFPLNAQGTSIALFGLLAVAEALMLGRVVTQYVPAVD